MKGAIHRRDEARRDLVGIARHLAREAKVRVADRYLTTAESTFRRLANNPGLGTRYEPEDPALGEIRYFPLPSRFRAYLGFYRPALDGIEVARIFHGSQDIAAILMGDDGMDG